MNDYLHLRFLFRTKKLKSIKDMAQKEIDEYKRAQEKVFQQKVAQKQNEIEEGFKKKQSDDPVETMAVIEKDFKANKSAVIEMLIANVLNVNVEVPRVVKGNFEDDE